jgi:DOPA 4,5-dioxygenase
MKAQKFPLNTHENYHAHVYFERETLKFANSLCENAHELFNLEVGRVHQKSIGPHPKWSCQIKFSAEDFDKFIAWLETNRAELSILVHALTGNNLQDHTEHAYWIGKAIELNIDFFKKT